MKLAVTTATLSPVRVPAVAVKFACDAPCGIVTEAGTARLALLSVTVIVVALVAAEDNETVHVALVFELSKEGVHVSELRAGVGTLADI